MSKYSRHDERNKKRNKHKENIKQDKLKKIKRVG